MRHQIQLSTLILVVLGFGLLLWANMVPRLVKLKGCKSDDMIVAIYPFVAYHYKECGWPAVLYREVNSAEIDVSLYNKTTQLFGPNSLGNMPVQTISELNRIFWPAVFFNCAVAISIAAAVVFASRRLERLRIKNRAQV